MSKRIAALDTDVQLEATLQKRIRHAEFKREGPLFALARYNLLNFHTVYQEAKEYRTCELS